MMGKMFVAGLFSTLKTYLGSRALSVGVLKVAAHGLLLAAVLLSMQREAAAVVTAWPNISFIKVSSGLVNPLTLSVADLSPGIYTVYLLVTPSGRLDAYYLGETSFVIP